MKYNYKEYEHIFDTPAKMQQERAIANKIMDLLNKNKYDNIYEFIAKNKTYQDFLKNNQFENVVKHFGNTLNERDYTMIIDEIVKLTEKKKNFDKEDLKTTNIDDKEYNSYKGAEKTYFLDNSNSNMSIERQMEELQKTEEKFQTSDEKQNTENMMKELEKNKKENLNLKYLKDINISILNEEERKIFNIAANYQLNYTEPLRVDINKKVIVDENDNIMKIQFIDGKVEVIGDESKQIDSIENTQTKTFQKILTPSNNTIYSNNN